MPNNSMALSRRFMALDADKRRVFLGRLREQGLSLSALPIPADMAGDDSPASFAQQRLWFIDRLEPGNSAYHLTGTLRLKGALDSPALQRAFSELAARHESLRTRFPADAEGQPRQQVEAPGAVPVERLELGKGESWQARARRFARQPFDLSQGPLWRVGLIALAEDDHVLVLCLHHIITDGWSIQVLLTELAACYQAALASQPPSLTPPDLQYRDFALWQRRTLEAGAGDEDLAYWREKLGGDLPVLELPLDYPRPAQRTYRGQRQDFRIAGDTTDKLRQLARAQGTTLFNVLLAGYGTLLHRLSGQDELCIGTPIAGRDRAELEGVIGLFVNTQVIRLSLEAGVSFADLLAIVSRTSREAQIHQGLPFERLVDAVQPDRSLSHNPLFQVLYNHQQQEAQQFELAPGLTAELQPQDSAGAQVDLALHTWETRDGGVAGTWSFATDLFEPQTIEQFHHRYEQLLAQVVATSEQAIGDFELLDETDRANLRDWNATATDHGQPEPMHRLFERQAAAHPDREALVFGDRRLSYGELDAAANRLAHYLRTQGVTGQSLVGVAAERSIEMVVALYAIQKAGTAYVPIDPDHPRARQQQVLADAGVDLLLTHDAVAARLPKLGELPVINLDGLDLSDESATVPDVAVHPLQRAYVIYTSGSTGKPKGVANNHAALYNRLQWMQAAYQLGEDDTVLQKTPYSFDVSVWEFFWPLMVGARLVVAQPGDHRDPVKLVELIEREQVTTIHFVPSMLSAFMAQENLRGCGSLRRIVCSGEALPGELQDQALERLPQAALYNLYGPTEAAIDVTHWTCGNDQRTTVPIGRPIDNLQIHILDGRLNEQPIGVPGELYIGGVGLAQGYHRRPDLTAERFVPSPFARGERLYRSGDLARWCRDGSIEYLGRLDHQIKLRGLRIELGEIEAVMRAHDTVQDAVVIARNDQLIGYVQGTGVDTDGLKTELGRHLPDYMVPAHIVALESFPLSANGKLDRKALPEPEVRAAEYEAPQGETEETLARLWQDMLGVKQVGRRDNFFALGGDSILSLRIIARAKAEGLELTPRELFEHQTIARLAPVVRHTQTAVAHHMDPDRAFALTPIQRWFFDHAMPNPSHWNQSLLLTPKHGLHTEALETALNAVINHHDALRLVFVREQDQWRQRYRPVAADHGVLWQRDVSPGDLPALFDQAQASLDLADGPLIRAVQIRLAGGGERLLLAIHHLAVDGVSWRILLDDLMRAYQQAVKGVTPDLGPKGTSFQSWSDRLQSWLSAEELVEEQAYWAAVPSPEPFRDIRVEVENIVAHLARETFSLSETLTRELLEIAPGAFRTRINDLLLTALGQAIEQWAGQCHPVIALEGHGREDLFGDIDLSRTVGWFTSLYPVRLPGGENLVARLKATKEILRAVPNGGLGYGVLRHLKRVEGLPDLAGAVMFNYLGQLNGDGQNEMNLADESPGANRSTDAPLSFELSMDGQVRNGRLEMVCSYSRDRHQQAAIKRLMSSFEQALINVLAICRKQTGITPSDVPLVTIDQAVLDALPLAPETIDDILPLTPMQQGLLFHNELGGAADLYVNQVSVTIDDLPVEAFRSAWAGAVSRHPILRAAFVQAPGCRESLQLIHRHAELAVRELDWRGRNDVSLDALCEQERTTPFDLARPPLMRLVLVRLNDRQWQMIWTLHHILLDGWSSAALLSEVIQQTLGHQIEAPPRYRDYFQWLSSRDAGASDQFWRAQLQDVSEPTRLAPLLADTAAPAHERLEGSDEVALTLDRNRVETFARQQQITLNTLVQAVWALLLQRYTGQRQVTFGATVAGRPADVAGMDRQLGLFINTLPVVQAPGPQQRVGDWLAELQSHNLALREHEHTPLYQIQQLAGQAGRELFDTLLVFENFPVDEALRGRGSGPQFSGLRVSERTHYPISIAVDAGQNLVLHLHYRKDQVRAHRAEALVGHLGQLIQAILQGADQRVGDLPLLTDRELALWNRWNRPDHPAVDPRPICALIANQAKVRPETIAVVHGHDRLTFADFDTRASRLAHWLIRQGVGAESRVGVALERGVDMLVALYAVHKTGAAYVPLDPDYPAQRVRYMLEDSGAGLLLSHEAALDRLPDVEGVRTINLDQLDLSDELATVPEVVIHPDQLAYLIYTSGSTGKPKGVAVTHGGISMHCQTIGARYGMTPEDRELQFLSISFDGAHERWLTALSHGARIVLRDQQLWSVQQTYDCLVEEGITVAAFPPSYLRQLAEWAELKGQPPGLRVICFAGEAFSRQMMRHAIEHLKPEFIINGYGPTETVVTPTLWKVPAATADFDSAYAPIGYLVGDRQGYVLDSDLNLLPPGVAGELYLGGALARGYLDRPGTTAERFVPNPFRSGERLYRTGDRVKLNRDGQLEYLGRMDQQIKLRGYRIEIGEVEAALKACEGVKDTLAMVKETAAGQRLVGYVSGEELDEGAIKAVLKEQLPDYMVPSHIVTLERLPLLPNGKLDRNALPEPVVDNADYEAPVTRAEMELAGLWQDILGVGQVGRQDNFFALGGHSLLGVNLVHRVQSELGRALPLSDLFEAETLADLAARLETEPHDAEPLQPRPRGAESPQSYAQQRLWFLAQLDPESSAYNLPAGLRLTGEMDGNAARRAFERLAQRHESLRTVFRHGRQGLPLQRVLTEFTPDFTQRDLRNEPEPEAALSSLFRDISQRPFDLETAPPWRVMLVQLTGDRWCLLLCMHHIITDGWSSQRLLQEWVRFYRSEQIGEPVDLSPLPLQYADFALWQRDMLSGEAGERQLAWWRDQLGGEHPTLDLPTDRPRPAQRDGGGQNYRFSLAPDLVSALRQVATRQRLSLFMVILGGFETLLYRLSGQRDIRVGVPVSGRHQPGTEALVGFFVNTLVLRAEMDPADRVSDLLEQVRGRMQGAQAHADLPFGQLVEALQPDRSLSHNPLFQASFNHQVVEERSLEDLGSLACEPLEAATETAHFDLTLATQEYPDGRIEGLFNFASDIFDVSSVARIATQLQQLLDVIAHDPDRRLADLPLLTQEDRGLWNRWNRPDHPAVDPRPICVLIANQAGEQPEAIAVVHGNERLTFADFDARANRLAHWLIRQGVGAESRVGVALERGVAMLVALYAVHKTGAAYVPLDPDYPAQRVQYMLEDSGADLLLSHEAALDRLPDVEGVRTFNLGKLDLSDELATVPEVVIHPGQLAYLIYTSGSTGKPKGVAVTHGGISMHCQTIGARYGMTPEDRELHFLSISFDGAHERWLTALSHGARIVLRDQQLWSVQQTYDCLVEEGITVAAFPPSYLRQLAEWAELKGQPPGLRVICFAGEAFSRQMMRHAIEHLKPEFIINGYGPTETVVTPTLWKVPAATADFDSAYAPIGDLVGDRQGYVLDSDLNLLPPGVAGELYLGGALARGYLDRPATTAERFVPNPFRPGERLYRTGDRVKLNRDGQLEYLGRMDQQIKLRGYRIEIGEVEAALKACEGVKDTLAVVKETAVGQRLVGYVSGEELDERAIKAVLKEQLPDYMVPSHIVTLDRLPQLPNGKLDRNALPEPDSAVAEHEPPEGERECLLAELWQAVLGVDSVSRGDSFFGLGGDSIQSLGLITRLRQAGWQLSTRAVFLKPRLAEMTEALEPLEAAEAPREAATGSLPLTPIQAHFFEQTLDTPAHWNQSLLLAARQRLDADRLQEALAAVIAHHDGFRLSFRKPSQGGHWQAFYRPGEQVERLFRHHHLVEGETVAGLCDRVQRSFDLEAGPLAGIRLIETPDGGQRLFLCAHHLIIDGVSWRILVDDLTRAYAQLGNGHTPELGERGVSYQQWAQRLEQSVAQGQWHDELDDWLSLAGDAEPWPVDNPDGRATHADAATCEVSLSPEQTQRLLRTTLSARHAGIDDLLLAALADGLGDWGGLASPLVAVEGHGREPVFQDLDPGRTLGWFTCLYPLRIEATGDTERTLERLQDQRARLPGKGIGFGVLRYLAEPEVRARLATIGEPPVAFNYLGQLDGEAGSFTPAPEGKGAEVAPSAPLARELEVTGRIHQGRLKLSIHYSRERYRAETVQGLLQAVSDRLEALIDGDVKTVVDAPAERSAGVRLDPLVRLAGSGHDAPQLFCPHPVSGTVVGYYPLAGQLSPQWQVWGLQNRQILDASWRDTSLAAMARDYVRVVLSQQPEGPYYLAGWSMGGALALEMATLLERLGKRVAFVGLIDGYVPGAGESRADVDEAPSPPGVQEDQWQQLLALERHMRHLARGHDRIRPLAAPVHAWWASHSPESNQGAEALLSEFLGQPLASSTWLPEDHLGLVRSPDLINALGQVLSGEAHAARLRDQPNMVPINT